VSFTFAFSSGPEAAARVLVGPLTNNRASRGRTFNAVSSSVSTSLQSASARPSVPADLGALFAQFADRVTVMMSLPLSLYPRASGLVGWIELLNDGVFELAPFPHSADSDATFLVDQSARQKSRVKDCCRYTDYRCYMIMVAVMASSDTDWTQTLIFESAEVHHQTVRPASCRR